MTKQIMTMKKTFTLKMKTLLTQRMLLMAISQTNHIAQVYDCLQQENMRLQGQVLDLTRESWSTVSAIIRLSSFTYTMTVPPVQTSPDPRVIAAAGRLLIPKQQKHEIMERNPKKTQQTTPLAPRLYPTPDSLQAGATPLSVYPIRSMVTVAAAGTSSPFVPMCHKVYTVMCTSTVRLRLAHERISAVKFLERVKNPTDADRKIPFHQATGTLAMS